ncbi:MAG: hypothetical protein KF821_00320 [Anaerolineales bacterium]|nr:hypothetical protein [Anaerolineales bacterium]MBX3004256.1 hypothetical protein [Anaerolineales bacterium]MCW5839203.1 hypothetical protein [Anaerolineales bacterium]MCW5888490.1 hypothetical protein [Anaerolineales bacterium]
MLEQKQKKVMPFIVSYGEAYDVRQAKLAPAPKRPGHHVTKDEATREVLTRIVHRVKKI